VSKDCLARIPESSWTNSRALGPGGMRLIEVFGTRKAPFLYSDTWPSATSFFVFWSGSSLTFVVAQPAEIIPRSAIRTICLFSLIIRHPHVIGNFFEHFSYHGIVRREYFDRDPIHVLKFFQINDRTDRQIAEGIALSRVRVIGRLVSLGTIRSDRGERSLTRG